MRIAQRERNGTVRGTRGAALIIAVAVLTILMAIALTFFTVSRVELKTSTNVENTVRAELLADAATAIAMSFLNYDKLIHPTYTSLDHAWRAYFNGAWIEGKQWAFVDPMSPNRSAPGYLQAHTPPNNVNYDDFYKPTPTDPSYGLPDNFYTPRYETGLRVPKLANYVTSGVNHPFLIDNASELPPAWQVHNWADVDNDGDGLRDSVWIPLVADTSVGLVADRYDDDPAALVNQTAGVPPNENRALAGLPNVVFPGDAVDNDLDDSLEMPLPEKWSTYDEVRRMELARTFFRSVGTDEANETAVFLYWGGDDGRDNNGSGSVDEPDEQRFFLTAPIYAAPSENSNDSIYQMLRNVNLTTPGQTTPSSYNIPCDPTLPWGPPDAQHRWVDVIDNDYDLVINNHMDYWTPYPEYYDFRAAEYAARNLRMYEVKLAGDENIYKFLSNMDPATDLGQADPGWRSRPIYQPALYDAVPNDTALIPETGVIITKAEATKYVDARLARYLATINRWNYIADRGYFVNGRWERGGRLAKAVPNLWPDFEFDKLRGAREIAPHYLRESGVAQPPCRLKSSGEPVCQIVGRAAILVNDEASKVNLNAAGAYTFDMQAFASDIQPLAALADVARSEANRYYWRPVFSSGANPFEYATLFLPGVGVDSPTVPVSGRGISRSRKMWNLLMGAPFGSLATGSPTQIDLRNAPDLAPDYVPDAVLPGYGFVDDDGNALALAMDGLDNNGNGLVDEGINDGSNLTPEQIAAAVQFGEHRGSALGFFDTNDSRTAEEKARFVYEKYLGYLEGIDDPGEYQRRRPLRNMVAEGRAPKPDGTYELDSVDGSGAAGAFGQLGDRVLKSRDEIKRVTRNEDLPPQYNFAQYQQNFFDGIKNHVTLHSTDTNNRFQQATKSDSIAESEKIWTAGQRPKGLKLDYNFATPEQIAQVLRDDWDMNSPANAYGDPAESETANEPLEFARGLQQEGVNVSLDMNGVFSSPVAFLDSSGNPVTALYKADPYLRALQLGANLRDARDTGYGRSTAVMQVDDTWWDRMQIYDQMNNHAVSTFDQARLIVEVTGDHRKIVYTVAGIEGVRITEMMVRPVRRVEAEMERDDVSSSLFPRYLYQLAYNADPSTATYKNNFDLTREQMRGKIPADYSITNQPGEGFWPEPKLPGSSTAVPDNPCNGFLNPWLGPGTAISTQTRFVEVIKNSGTGSGPPTEHWPNIMEFKFGPSKGLPPGRYYLKINTTDYRGRPTVSGPRSGTVDVPWYRNNMDPIRVAIKYVSDSDNPSLPLGMTKAGKTTIAEDVAEGFAAFATNPDDEFYDTATDTNKRYWNDYWTYYWRGPYDANGGVGLVLGAQSLKKADVDDNGKVTFEEAADLIPSLPQELFAAYDTDGDGTLDLATEGIPCQNRTGATERGVATGWIFVPGLDDDVLDVPPSLTNEATRFAGYGQDKAFTVTIPPKEDNPANQVYLHVAVCMGGGDPVAYDGGDPRLCINSFEFSQEPDHEWVEIENITGHDIDISGWELTVGGVDPATGDIVTEDRIFMQVPNDPANPTILPAAQPDVAAGAVAARSPRMLLAVNAYDYIDYLPNVETDRDNLLFQNGIGLEGGSFYGTGGDEIYNGADSNGYSVTVPDFPVVPYDEYGTYNVGESGNLFRRRANDLPIVQLEIEGLTTQAAIRVPQAGGVNAAESLGVLAGWVLRGGVFPNNPEHDGIDNDNDVNTLLFDGVDNNGDGTVDDLLEGIDEGRQWMDARRESIAGLFVPNPAPGAFDFLPVAYKASYFDYPYDPLNYVPPPAYFGAAASESPRWKEFIERRFYPGDNVVVTLFQGDHQANRVVDRVTYIERDVINRAIDDGIPVPSDAFGNSQLPTLYDKSFGVPIPNYYLNFWPDDTMGADFYRTLERKHSAIYNGDRFGTSNRWEATDGNYDDWSHDPVLLRQKDDNTTDVDRFNGTPLQPNAAYDPEFEYPIFYYPHSLPAAENTLMIPQVYRKWTPAYAARRDALALDRKTIAHSDQPFVSVGEVMTLPYLEIHENHTLAGNEFGAFHAELAAFPVKIPGLAREKILRARVGQTYPADYWQKLLWKTGAQESDDMLKALMNAAAFDPVRFSCARADFHLLRPVFDPNDLNDNQRVREMMKFDPASDPLATAPWPLPEVWRPVFLYSLDISGGLNRELFDTQYNLGFPYNVWGKNLGLMPNTNYFLFNRSPVPAMLKTGNDLWSRSPVQSRTAFYLSGNPEGFSATRQPESDRPAAASPEDLGPLTQGSLVSEALFVWNADDGIEDGVYDLYLDTGQPFDRLLAADDAFKAANPGQTLLTDMGRALCEIAASKTPGDIILDAEVFTDRDRDGRCWFGDAYPTRYNLLRPGADPNNPAKTDSLGMQEGLTPDDNGVVYYGVVEIQNNYLALYLRNWSVRGVPATFAGIILTPRDRTSGRININTVEMIATGTAGSWKPFNTLMGLPGMLLDVNVLDPLGSDYTLSATGWATLDRDALPTLTGAQPSLGLLPIMNSGANAVSITQRTWMIVAGRPGTTAPHYQSPVDPNRADGRYYKSVDELLSLGAYRSVFTDPTHPNLNNSLYPLSVQFEDGSTPAMVERQRWNRFEEERWRFSRMANMITVRSDLFEIIATVQAGYGTDANGDGEINWRSNDEFVTTAEKKVRTIYER